MIVMLQLFTESGYRRRSGITETEDVSYVSSPYLPEVLRAGDNPTTDNTSRSHESAAGVSGIKDELSEAIQLAGVHILVGEWIPFGSNQVQARRSNRDTFPNNLPPQRR